MKDKKKACVYIWSLIMLLLMNEAYGQRASYNLDAPEKFNLPNMIDEISGITFLNDSVLLAVDDEHGKVFQFSLNENIEVSGFTFGKDKDYEGITRVKSQIYILQSKGNLYSFPYKIPIGETEQFNLNVKGKNQFEIVYYDVTEKKLVLICKKCKTDSKSVNSAWAFDLTTKTFKQEPFFIIKREAIEKGYGKSIKRFKPSAAAIHPLSGDLYIISSINKLLVVMDNKTKSVKSVTPLERTLFKQPEGIAFNPDGDMIISNEAAGKGPANIILFRLQ